MVIVDEKSFVGYGSYQRPVCPPPLKNPFADSDQETIKSHLDEMRKLREERVKRIEEKMVKSRKKSTLTICGTNQFKKKLHEVSRGRLR
ncbi:MAG: hypothetical protein QMD50_00220 [Patescibacteria group bacterium]|nr:hypothetical protein [Patescibacteria group bacterium]